MIFVSFLSTAEKFLNWLLRGRMAVRNISSKDIEEY